MKAVSSKWNGLWTNVLSRDRFSTLSSGKATGISTTRGWWKAVCRMLRKPLKTLKFFCHRCQKPEGGVVLGIDILISIYVTYLCLTYVYIPWFRVEGYSFCMPYRHCWRSYGKLLWMSSSTPVYGDVHIGALCSLCTHSQLWYSILIVTLLWD